MARSLDRFKEINEMRSKKKQEKELEDKKQKFTEDDLNDLLKGLDLEERSQDNEFENTLKGEVNDFDGMTTEDIEAYLSDEKKDINMQDRINDLFK